MQSTKNPTSFRSGSVKVKDILRHLGWKRSREKCYGFSRLKDGYGGKVKDRTAKMVLRNIECDVIAFYMASERVGGKYENATVIFKSCQKYHAFSARYASDNAVNIDKETLCSAMLEIKKESNRAYNNRWKCVRDMARGKIKKELLKQISIEAI